MKVVYGIHTSKGIIYSTQKPAFTDHFYAVFPSNEDIFFEEVYDTYQGFTIRFKYSRFASKCQVDCLRTHFFNKCGFLKKKLQYVLMPYPVYDKLRLDDELVGYLDKERFAQVIDETKYGKMPFEIRRYK